MTAEQDAILDRPTWDYRVDDELRTCPWETWDRRRELSRAFSSSAAAALEEWHKPIPDYRRAVGNSVLYHAGGVAGVDALPLEWGEVTDERTC